MKISTLLLALSLLFLINCTPRTNNSIRPFTPPSPDPYYVSGDSLYTIYRKGLITRHIAKNGRLLESIGLKSIDGLSEDEWKKQGNSILVPFPDGDRHKIDLDNIRYSLEKSPDNDSIKPQLWVPIVAPIKEPGLGQEIYEVLASDGDNPLYYGGMALATFSLESIHKVSDYSIHYARKLIEFFLKSEMNGQNGYMIRQARPFNSGRNRNGQPIIQGASSEELLGLMLGIMYYLQAEDPQHPLYQKAYNLRRRVLQKVSRGYIYDKYKHPFMLSNSDPSYRVKHFEFPMYASSGEHRPGTFDVMEQTYISTLTLGSGNTRPTNAKFFDYAMFLTSMILVLDGDLRADKKEWFAKQFMRHVIKAAKTAGPDIAGLTDHAYMAVVAQLVNKYLNDSRDSWRTSTELSDIWGSIASDDWRLWRHMRTEEVDIIFRPNRDESLLKWQHNLPFLNLTDGEQSDYWKNHNEEKRIGDWFTWVRKFPHYYNKSWGWQKAMPGWHHFNDSNWQIQGPDIGSAAYIQGNEMRYTAHGFIENDLVNNGHHNNQVEGAGLGLLFLRMLLTNINPQRYPAPVLHEDEWFQTLPYNGIEPMGPSSFSYGYNYYSKDDNPSFEIRGDRNDALRMIKLGKDDYGTSSKFVVAYATSDEKLKLAKGSLNSSTVGEGTINLDKQVTWKRFDRVALTETKNSRYFVVAERAEQNTILPYKDHWLRISLWNHELEEQDRWTGPRSNGAVKEIDLDLLGDDHVVVAFKSRHNKNRLRIFRIDYDNQRIVDRNVVDFAGNDIETDGKIYVTTAFQDIIIAGEQRDEKFRLNSKRFQNNSIQNRGVSSSITGKLLDITTVKRADFSEDDQTSNEYIVAVYNKKGFLSIISWEVLNNGSLVYRGEFNTKEAEFYLLNRESEFDRASISPSYYNYQPGFIIAGKGNGLITRDGDGNWKKTDKGLRVLKGEILDDGSPTILCSQPLGAGNNDAMRMLDIATNVSDGESGGFLTSHKTKDNYLILSYWLHKDFN